MTIRTLLATLVGATLCAPAALATDIVIGSSSPGGSYNLYAGGLAAYLTENVEGVDATARTTRGSVENVRLLDRGDLDFAFANGTVLAQQKAGEFQFSDAQSDKIRGIALIDLSPTHWVTSADSPIEAPVDLAGKRVSIGAAGSGGANTAMMVLDTLELPEPVQVQNLGFSESANNLRDGNLEAFAGGSALPMPAVVDLSTTQDIRLLTFDEAFLEKLQERAPAMERAVIPAGTYRGVDTDIITMGNPSTLITREDMDEEIVYQLAKALITDENKEYMRAVYNAWEPEPAPGLWKRIGVPLHPGAERAYREAGLIE
ncbi:TAXI family TRAP transporter solute-binding subunit [Acuticoccus sp. M5D2P5]|uniref:TAXI family TRAP transporter solute-binding subunit n=1 Tax=Acuticoccus kalidii TaxID=2910977 RepID=UPI001F1DA6D7|nr:TAXI family TRAP transporter solute-binding subunit [Acuticoccus kalidii]MCF3934780.1 TAXI family TRAP transporter solute-binding subunit [Acuticoccus kalidii]